MHACDKAKRKQLRNEARFSTRNTSRGDGKHCQGVSLSARTISSKKHERTKNRATNVHVYIWGKRWKKEESQLRESTRVSFPEPAPFDPVSLRERNVQICDWNQRGLCSTRRKLAIDFSIFPTSTKHSLQLRGTDTTFAIDRRRSTTSFRKPKLRETSYKRYVFY